MSTNTRDQSKTLTFKSLFKMPPGFQFNIETSFSAYPHINQVFYNLSPAIYNHTYSINQHKYIYIHSPSLVKVPHRQFAPTTCNQITRLIPIIVNSSVQDGMQVLKKAHMHSTPSLRSFPNVAFETVPMLV